MPLMPLKVKQQNQLTSINILFYNNKKSIEFNLIKLEFAFDELSKSTSVIVVSQSFAKNVVQLLIYKLISVKCFV